MTTAMELHLKRVNEVVREQLQVLIDDTRIHNGLQLSIFHRQDKTCQCRSSCIYFRLVSGAISRPRNNDQFCFPKVEVAFAVAMNS